MCAYLKYVFIFFSYILYILFFPIGFALAAIPSSVIEEQKKEVQEIEKQQRLDIETINQSTNPSTLTPKTEETPSNKGWVKEKICTKIDRIVFSPSYILRGNSKRRLIAPFLGKCLGKTSIKNLWENITKFYIREGYITSRVVLEAQNLKKGTLKILLIEGRVDKIRKVNPQDKSFSLATAFPNLEGKILNMRDFEQGIEQLNRLNGVSVKVDYVPSDKVGYTDVVVFNTRGSPWQNSVSINNSGSSSTGKYQVKTSVSRGNLLGLNELLTLSAQQSFLTESSVGDNKNISAVLNIPYGYWNLITSISKTLHRSLIAVTNNNFISNGDSSVYKVEGTYTLSRSKDSKWTANGSFEYSSQNNYLGGSKVESTSYGSSKGYLGVKYTKKWKSYTLDFSAGISRQLPNLNGRKIPPTAVEKVPVWDTTVTWTAKIPVRNSVINFTSAWTAQYATKPLVKSNISIGGSSSVRGPASSILFGDRGFYVRNDFKYTIPMRLDTPLIAGITSLTPSAFLDYGWASNLQSRTFGDVLGAGVGISVNAQKYSLNVFYAKLVQSRGDVFVAKKPSLLSVSVTVPL